MMTSHTTSPAALSLQQKCLDLAAAGRAYDRANLPGPLSDTDIALAILSNDVVITSELDVLIQPASIDLRLSHHTKRYLPNGHDTEDDCYEDHYGIPIDHIKQTLEVHGAPNVHAFINKIYDPLLPPHFVVLPPKSQVLASTVERLTLSPAIRGQIRGKSRYDRMFVFVTCGGGYVDPGYDGQLTLAISNNSPRTRFLQVGAPICQIELSRLVTPSAVPYGTKAGSHYQASAGPTAAR